MKITIVGTSGAVPTSMRDTTMIAVTIRDHVHLFDCGGSVIHRLERFSLNWLDIHSIFFTHHHIDHIYGFVHIIQGFYLKKRQKPLYVYGPAETLKRLRATMDVHGLLSKNLGFSIHFSAISTTESENVGPNAGISVSTCPVIHGVPAVAYRCMECDTTHSFVYSGDTGFSAGLVTLSTETDLLIHETCLHFEPMPDPAIHSTVMDAMRVAAESQARHLCLIHFNTEPEIEKERIFALQHQYYHGEMSIAREGMVFSFDEQSGRIAQDIMPVT